MSFAILPPILIVAGLVLGVVIAFRRLPQVAELRGEDLEAAERARKERKENPSRLRRSWYAIKHALVLAGQAVQKAARFVTIKILKRAIQSDWLKNKVQALVSSLQKNREQKKAAKAKARATEPAVAVQAEAVETTIPTVSVQEQLEEEKKEHEQAMEVARLGKKARHELLVNNLAGAEKLYIEMVSKDASSLIAYRGLVEVYEKQGNRADAKAALEQILKIDKHDIEAKKKLEQLAEQRVVA